MVQDPKRPNPDELLSRIQADERRQSRGRCKILIGYAAGVGKTYAMLEAARQRQAEGVDVVVAYIETHGRPETEAQLADLQVLPRKQIEYRGMLLPELDVDGVLARRPQLALVDELAHTCVPGSRHAKRFQDVEEILAAGIDVYTTLNIQHLESLNDVVAQITGITVQETIPDSVIEDAAELELVDLPPEELRQRLKDGKVYVPEQAAQAIARFFRIGNLTALRQLTMRHAAQRVDEQMRAYMQMRAIPGPWPATERLLVCINPGPHGEHLVRAARRLAGKLNAEWEALYVKTPDELRLSQAEQDQIARALHLCEELGGRVVTLTGRSVAEEVMDYAQRHNVTQIVVGKPLQPPWRELVGRTIADRLIRTSGSIDVYVVSTAAETARPPDKPRRPSRMVLWQYGRAMLLVALATLIGQLVHNFVTLANIVMVYLLVVVIAAVYLGRGPAVVAAILSVLLFDFFLVSPFLTFAVSDTQYLFTFLVLLVVGLLISNLTARVREQRESARRREQETSTMYALSRDLAVAVDLPSVVQAIVFHASETVGQDVVVLLPDSSQEGLLRPSANDSIPSLDEQELAVAIWAFDREQPAGQGTDTLPAAKLRYLPLKTARGKVGVLGVRPAGSSRYLVPEQRRLLEAFASLSAVAIERVQLAAAAGQVQILEAAEKLQTALLSSISHDLRTPLVSITGALTSLQDGDVCLDDHARRTLVETAAEEAGRLNRLVGNLLDMTRLEAGVVRANLERRDIQDVVGAALQQVDAQLGDRPVQIDIPATLPLIPLDFVLLVHTLTNLIDNAIKYSPPGSPIEIRAWLEGPEVQIRVADRGVGIPEEDLERVFQKFYRVQRPESVAGTGLGLSISKGLVEAQGGRIWAENRPGGGATVTIALPRALAESNHTGDVR